MDGLESFVGDAPAGNPPPVPPAHPGPHSEQENEGFMSGPHAEAEHTGNPSVCGGPNNQFTTQAQLNDASNNLVNRNQVNSVATFCPEFNAQGSNPPQGFGSWNSAHASF